MKICKVRPDYSTCSACIATQEMFNVVDDCGKCKLNTDTYELLQIGTGFWSGDYAMVQKGGKITKVSLSRVYDVKETSDECMLLRKRNVKFVLGEGINL